MTQTTVTSFLRRAVAAAGLAVLAAAAVAPGVAVSANGPAAKGIEAHALKGTWRVHVQTFRCDNPNIKNPAFDSILTFGADGSLIETTSSAQFQPGQRSIGHGRWERLGPGAYRAVSEAFIQFGVDPSVPPPALRRGRQRIDQGIQMTSRDSFVSDATVAFYGSTAPDNVAPYLTGCATATGERFE